MTATELALLLTTALLSMGCDAPCPSGTQRAPAHSARLTTLLGDSAPASGLEVCFGIDIEPGVTPDGVVLLDGTVSDVRAAARLAHLVHHLAAGMPWREAGDDDVGCEVRVNAALARERAAFDVELRTLERLGGDPPSAAELTERLQRLGESYRSRCP